MSTRDHSASRLELITIDLDGTLVDSVADLHAATVRMLAALSEPTASLDDVRAWIGNGMERLVHRAMTRDMQVDAEDTRFAAAVEHFLAAYEEFNGHHACLYPGVTQGLDWLASQGMPLVLVTNKARRFTAPLMDRLGIAHYFVHQISGDDVPAKKPDPAALLLAAQLIGAEPACSVMIGDSVSDIRAARAAGFASISVRYGYNHGEPVDRPDSAWPSDAVIDSLLELPGVFEQLLQQGQGKS